MTRVRIDRRMVDLLLAPTRQKAQALLMANQVLVNEVPVTKAGTLVSQDAVIRIKEQLPFVSRGGLKLENALNQLKLSVEGLTVLDVGASTGGFSDCCLQRGAARIYAVDVGTNQLDWRLRSDPRVLCLEKQNARELGPHLLPTPADLAVIDVSFISITLILAPVLSCLCSDGRILAMVKPQFEVGKDRVGKGGVVRDDEDRQRAVDGVVSCAQALGLHKVAACESGIPGPRGNREIFVLLAWGDKEQ